MFIFAITIYLGFVCYWEIIELMAEFSSQEIVIIDSDDDFEDNPIIPDNPIIVSHSELENRDSSQLLPYSCFVCGEDISFC